MATSAGEMGNSNRSVHGRPLDSETGIQVLARLRRPPPIEDLDPVLFGKLEPSTAIEVSGASGCGKTELMYHLVCRCILPASVGGLACKVVYIDTDHHFDVLRLSAILHNRVNAAPVGESAGTLVQECLRSLFLVRCSSSEELLLALHSLDQFLIQESKVSLLVIDSMSSFYWLDRMKLLSREANDQRLALLLRHLVDDYKLCLAMTKQALTAKQHLSAERILEKNFKILRLVLEKDVSLGKISISKMTRSTDGTLKPETFEMLVDAAGAKITRQS